jgi:hypothetical protein
MSILEMLSIYMIAPYLLQNLKFNAITIFSHSKEL